MISLHQGTCSLGRQPITNRQRCTVSATTNAGSRFTQPSRQDAGRKQPDDQAASAAPAPSGANPPLITSIAAAGASFRTSRRGLMLASAALIGCPCCNQLAAKADAPAKGAAPAPAWGYGDVSGPVSWKGVCATGKRQSPVALSADANIAASRYGIPAFTYASSDDLTVLNTGHGTMQVNFPPGNQVNIPLKVPVEYEDGLDLELLQYHFHTPSEHALEGKRYAMEAHLVHRNMVTGGLAVIGVLLQSGGSQPNKCLQAGLDYASAVGGETKPFDRNVDPSDLLPPKTDREYIHYTGSLTTPPCYEGVDWFVMTEPVQITDKQFVGFMEYAGGGLEYPRTARPLQPLNGRALEI